MESQQCTQHFDDMIQMEGLMMTFKGRNMRLIVCVYIYIYIYETEKVPSDIIRQIKEVSFVAGYIQ